GRGRRPLRGHHRLSGDRLRRDHRSDGANAGNGRVRATSSGHRLELLARSRSHAAFAPPVRSKSGVGGEPVAQMRRRSLAQAVSWWRFESWSLRSTAETWVSIVFTDRLRRAATSL